MKKINLIKKKIQLNKWNYIKINLYKQKLFLLSFSNIIKFYQFK